ncbi:MAG: TlpA disulfide reductase family protein [Pseudomonadota bacterium]
MRRSSSFRRFLAVVLYGALAAGASPALALTETQIAALREARAGEMRKLIVHDAAKAPYQAAFDAAEGGKMTMAAYEGRIVLLNFWATWCAPCREEMPALNALENTLGGEDFAVVTVATGRNSPSGMQRFFEEYGIDALPLHKDPRGMLGREAAVIGLPVTVILDRDGREVARLIGGADWAAPEAEAILRQVIAESGS